MFIAEMKNLEEIYPGISQIYLSVLTKDIKLTKCHTSDISRDVYLKVDTLKEYINLLIKRKELYFVEYGSQYSYSTGYLLSKPMTELVAAYDLNIEEKIKILILLRDFAAINTTSFNTEVFSFVKTCTIYKNSLKLKKKDLIDILVKVIQSPIKNISQISTNDIENILNNNIGIKDGIDFVDSPIEQRIMRNIVKIITKNNIYKIGDKYNKDMVEDLFNNLNKNKDSISFSEIINLMKNMKPSIELV